MPCVAATLVVRPDGSGPYSTIQAAVDAAAQGDSVLLAPGTFTGAGNRAVTLVDRSIAILAQEPGGTVIVDCEFSGRWLACAGTGSQEIRIGGIEVRYGRSYQGPGSSGQGGAIEIVGPLSIHLQDCRLTENTADRGGAIFSAGADLELLQCSLDHNSTVIGPGRRGGALLLEGGSCDLRESTIQGCGSVQGGGVYADAATVNGTGCVVSGCIADRAAAILVAGAAMSLANCTFDNNGGTEQILLGPGSAAKVERTIIAFGLFGDDTEAITCAEGVAIDLRDCDLWGRKEPYSGCVEGLQGQQGNVSWAPRFCSEAWANLSLCADSPCLPENHPSGIQIGALGAGCGPCGPTPTLKTTWGRLKARAMRGTNLGGPEPR
jgi:hypothetical protein